MKKKYLHIHTFGCQMNVHDSEQIMELLRKYGYEETRDIGKSDLIIINTCSVRVKAEQKVYSLLGRLKGLKEKKSDLVIGVGGCLAQQLGMDLLQRFSYVDLVFGTHEIHCIPEMLKKIEYNRCRIAKTEFHESVRSMDVVVIPENRKVAAYVTNIQGCDNVCTYCIVPYVRGREQSRDSADIVNEIEALAENGVKEVLLLGQNVNSYGRNLADGQDFPKLLKKISEIEGIERIRFTTSHPKDLSDELINCFASMEKLCEHIHLPVQSGSDSVLERMKRGYTIKEYRGKVEKLRSVCPSIGITSDIIVGFPGESDVDFQRTIELMEKVKFDNTFSFVYSERSGTVAERYDKKVDNDVKMRRLSFLQSVQERHTLEKNRLMLGSVTKILVEGLSKNNQNDVTGRTGTNKIVNVGGNVDVVGKIIPVKITEAYMHSLRGELDGEYLSGCLSVVSANK